MADFIRRLYSAGRYRDPSGLVAFCKECRERTFSLNKVRQLLASTGDFPLNVEMCPTTGANVSALFDILGKEKALACIECIQALISFLSFPSKVDGTACDASKAIPHRKECQIPPSVI